MLIMSDNNISLTVLTPTYNRVDRLPLLYQSLLEQSDDNFQWLVIDDGSKDGTRDYFNTIDKSRITIDYYFKENGGKHTAINYAIPYIKGNLVVFVDSDDTLTPDAVETIKRDWIKYFQDEKIAVISYMKQHSDGTPMSPLPPYDYYTNDDISYRVNHKIPGDRCEVLRTSVLKQYRFPTFKNEKFMSEGWLWRRISLNSLFVYRTKAIYTCEYLEGGLTKSGRAFRMKNPYGMIENCKSYFLPQVKMSVQIKEMILLQIYSNCAGISFKDKILCSPHHIWMIILTLPCMAITANWRIKYKI